MCHLNDRLISRCILSNCIFCIIQSDNSTTIPDKHRNNIRDWTITSDTMLSLFRNWNILQFLISAISIDSQNSAKIQQPQKIPVIRYYLFLLDRVASLFELWCRSQCGDGKWTSHCYRRKQINVMWCTKPVNAWFLVHLSQRLKCTIVIMRCSLSVCRNFSHFRLLLWNRWTEFNETWQEARSQCPLPSLCFSGRSEIQDGCPGLWLAETCLLLIWNRWTELDETW